MPTKGASEKFVDAVRRSLLCAAPELRDAAQGTKILVACSGGPDSTALVLALCALSGELQLELTLCYVDHGLREAAAAEGEAVLALGAALEVPARVARISVAPGSALLARARRLRYQALGEVATEIGAPFVAVGHTASDQAETMLMRQLGGAGLRGVAGIPRRRRLFGQTLIRPLLDCDREQVAALLAEAGVEAASDPTNQDMRFLRARLRQRVLPLLRAERPGLDRHLGALADSLREDAEFLDGLAEEALRLRGDRGEGLDARWLASLPGPVARRVLSRRLGPLPRQQIARLLSLCQRRLGSVAVDLPDGRRAERRYGRLILTTQATQDGAAEVEVTGPGRYTLFHREILFEHAQIDRLPRLGRDVACFYGRAFPLRLRPPRPGDRIVPYGMTGRRKLSDLFIDERVPRPLRPQQVLLCAGSGADEEVLWVVGLRQSDPAVRGAGGQPPSPGQPQLLVARWLNSGK